MAKCMYSTVLYLIERGIKCKVERELPVVLVHPGVSFLVEASVQSTDYSCGLQVQMDLRGAITQEKGERTRMRMRAINE